MPPGTLWLHCNGGHYFRGSSHCPFSGYSPPRASDILALAAHRTTATYQALLDAGIQERELMHTLVLPLDFRAPHPWPCAFHAPPDLIEFVVRRNQWLLERFPSGALAAALIPRPTVERTYCQLPGQHWWYLSDPRSSAHWPAAMTAERQAMLAGCSQPGARFFPLMVDADHPSLIIDPQYWNPAPARHPLIPAGHLLLS